MYVAYYKLAKKYEKGTGFAICTVLFTFICLPILAFSKEKSIDNSNGQSNTEMDMASADNVNNSVSDFNNNMINNDSLSVNGMNNNAQETEPNMINNFNSMFNSSDLNNNMNSNMDNNLNTGVQNPVPSSNTGLEINNVMPEFNNNNNISNNLQ